MWSVQNNTPFLADGYFVRDRHGKEYWCVALRARFSVRDDGFAGLAEQLPVRLAPLYRDEDARELLAEADFAPFRPNTDILLSGDAMLKDRRRTDQVPVGIRVGQLAKRALALCPRRIVRKSGSWRFAEQTPVEQISLSWTNALGGRDPFASGDMIVESEANPIGKGWSRNLARARDGDDLVLPQIESPDALFHPDRPMPEPVGFGPVQPGWSSRLDHAGTYDGEWEANRAPLLPSDFSETFYNAAPSDQIYPGELRGGEPVELEGLHHQGSYSFRLPQCIIESSTRIAGKTTKHRFRLISVGIEANDRVVDMVWNAQLPCNGIDHQVEFSTLTLKQMSGVVA